METGTGGIHGTGGTDGMIHSVHGEGLTDLIDSPHLEVDSAMAASVTLEVSVAHITALHIFPEHGLTTIRLSTITIMLKADQ